MIFMIDQSQIKSIAFILTFIYGFGGWGVKLKYQ